MALLIVFSHEDRQNQFTMFEQQLFHRGAVVIKFFDNSEDHVPIFKTGREKVYVYNYIDHRNGSR